MITRRIVNARLVNEGLRFDGELAWNGMALLAEPIVPRLQFNR